MREVYRLAWTQGDSRPHDVHSRNRTEGAQGGPDTGGGGNVTMVPIIPPWYGSCAVHERCDITRLFPTARRFHVRFIWSGVSAASPNASVPTAFDSVVDQNVGSRSETQERCLGPSVDRTPRQQPARESPIGAACQVAPTSRGSNSVSSRSNR